MKIAGRKNSGAWFRTNKAIKALQSDEKANLAGSIASSDYIDAAYNALVTMQDRTGIDLAEIPTSKDVWAEAMVENGIPHQIWMGRLSWTTTTKTGTGSSAKYLADHQSEIHFFGKDLRAKVKQYFLARRQMRDLFNLGSSTEGNPGGQPNATKEA